MLSLVVARQELLPQLTDVDEAVRQQDVENEERGEIHPLPVPRLSETLHDSRSDDGEEGEAAELERTVFEVSSGDFEVTRIDIMGVVRRQWSEGDGAAATPPSPPRIQGRAETRAGDWRFVIRGSAGSWRR
jgi:hypothetical protein